MKKKLVALLITCLTLSSCFNTETEKENETANIAKQENKQSIEVLITSGEASILKDQNWEKISTTSEQKLASRIKTGDNGTASLVMPDQTIIRLNNKTELLIESYTEDQA